MEENKTTIGGLSINYKTFGAKSAKTVLVLHGWGKGSDSWVEVGKMLAKKGYHAVCPDLPGFGRSDEPKIPWAIADYLKFVQDFCAELKLDGFYLAGHSFGGGVSAAFVAHNPGIVKKLVLIDSAIARKERLGLRQAAAKIMAGGKELFLKLPFADKLRPMAEKLVYKIAGAHDYQKTSGIMRQTFKNILGEDLISAADFIKIPVLIIWGRDDSSTPLEDAFILEKKIPGAKLKIIDGCGHNPHVTHPRELAGAIDSFLTLNKL